jgi:hypothetical protein
MGLEPSASLAQSQGDNPLANLQRRLRHDLAVSPEAGSITIELAARFIKVQYAKMKHVNPARSDTLGH